MTGLITALRWIARIAFILALIIGAILWAGQGYTYLRPHIWLGFVIAIALLLIAIAALIRRVRIPVAVLAVLWAFALPGIGFGQLQLLPGPNHDVIRVIHLIIGIVAIGLCEMLGLAVLRASR